MTSQLWVLAFAVACTLVFTEGTLFKPIRERGPKLWRDLATCALCVGVWFGFAWFAAWFELGGPEGWYREPTYVLTVFGMGALTGVLAYFGKMALDVLDALDTRP